MIFCFEDERRVRPDLCPHGWRGMKQRSKIHRGEVKGGGYQATYRKLNHQLGKSKMMRHFTFQVQDARRSRKSKENIARSQDWA